MPRVVVNKVEIGIFYWSRTGMTTRIYFWKEMKDNRLSMGLDRWMEGIFNRRGRVEIKRGEKVPCDFGCDQPRNGAPHNEKIP